MIDKNKITALRIQRQHLMNKADIMEYDLLYRDLSPGQNVYWNGFGDPPSITFRADFNDIEYNRERQRQRILIKGRFQGGNVGWIEQSDMELFAGLYRKPLDKPLENQLLLLELINREGPMNIGLMKELTGMLVKEITPALHRLQEAFLIYEDQYDGEWDRGWYRFGEMFPEKILTKYTRHDALKIILQRFSYRQVYFNTQMAKSFYRLPEKDIKKAAEALVSEDMLINYENGYLLKDDCTLVQNVDYEPVKSVFVMHRNDFLVKSNDYWLKEKFRNENDILQYILIDGDFHGAVTGHFKNGPYIIEDIILDISENEISLRKDEIINAVYTVNDRNSSPVKSYNGKPLY